MSKTPTHEFSTELPTGEVITVNAVDLQSAYSKMVEKVPDLQFRDIFQVDSKEPHFSDRKLRQESSIFRQYAITASPTRVVVMETTHKRLAYRKFLEDGFNIKPEDVYQKDSQLPHSDDEKFDREHGILTDDSE